jgi:hypothetical protein
VTDSHHIPPPGGEPDPLAGFPRAPVHGSERADQPLARGARPAPGEREDDPDPVTDVLEQIKDKLGNSREPAVEAPSVEQAITLREQAPELYDLWLKIAQEKAATANYVDRAPYEVPERLAQSGRPRALGALIIVLSFCGYLAWLGGPGVYIAGVIALFDLVAMLAVLFALRPDRLAEPRRAQRPRRRRLPPARAQALTAAPAVGSGLRTRTSAPPATPPPPPARRQEPQTASMFHRCACSSIHVPSMWLGCGLPRRAVRARALVSGALHCCSTLTMEGHAG